MALDFSSADTVRYRRVALCAARRVCGSRHCAEDVAQEALVLLYRNRDRLTSDRAVYSWLRTTATRLAHRCCAERRRVSPLDEALDGECVEDGIADRVDHQRVIARIASQMRSLPRVQRDLLKAIYFEGLSYAEVSQRLGLSVGSIGPTRGRAIERLIVACGTEGVHVA